MLQNDFYIVHELSGSMPSFRVLLIVNAQHRIFEGHFPGQPVVPGVCLMQMVQEITAMVLGGVAPGGPSLRLLRANQMKFMSPIDPRTVGELEMTLDCNMGEGGKVSVTASLAEGGRAYFKFSGVFEQE